VQLLSLGVIGEYLGRMFNEAKKRPLYLVNQYVSSQGSNSGARASRPEGDSA
jgi:hypothetical protein